MPRFLISVAWVITVLATRTYAQGTGATGMTGPMGPAGPSGIIGSPGPRGFVGSPGSRGAPGPAGPRGYTGVAYSGPNSGRTGGTGATGATGVTGYTGETGSQGIPGAMGPLGRVGPPGPNVQKASAAMAQHYPARDHVLLIFSLTLHGVIGITILLVLLWQRRRITNVAKAIKMLPRERPPSYKERASTVEGNINPVYEDPK